MHHYTFSAVLIDIELHSLDSYSDDNNILIVKTKKFRWRFILYKPLFNSGLQNSNENRKMISNLTGRPRFDGLIQTVSTTAVLFGQHQCSTARGTFRGGRLIYIGFIVLRRYCSNQYIALTLFFWYVRLGVVDC